MATTKKNTKKSVAKSAKTTNTEKVESFAPSAHTDQQAQIEALQAQINSLLAVIGGRAAQKQEDRLVRVTNTSDVSIAVRVINDKGLPEDYFWHQRGDQREMPFSHAKYILEKYPHMYENGTLSCPDVVGHTPNSIPDIRAFLDNLEIGEVNTRIEAITSKDTLWALHNHLESMRFADEPIVEKDGLTLPQRTVEPKYALIHQVVRERLFKVANVQALTHAV